ncbi:MAG: hypothetical protein MJE68_18720 [Proteobacteria bacterium]|nr:hypothetical protein [Pseudomonadota bacterium]
MFDDVAGDCLLLLLEEEVVVILSEFFHECRLKRFEQLRLVLLWDHPTDLDVLLVIQGGCYICECFEAGLIFL